jgi:hypothetical protein
LSQIQEHSIVRSTLHNSFGFVSEIHEDEGIVKLTIEKHMYEHRIKDLRLMPAAPYSPFKCWEGLLCLSCQQMTLRGFKSLRGTDHALDTLPLGSIATVNHEGTTQLGVVGRRPYRSDTHQFYVDLLLGSGKLVQFEYSKVMETFCPLTKEHPVKSAVTGDTLGLIVRLFYQKDQENVVDVQAPGKQQLVKTYKLSDISLHPSGKCEDRHDAL